MAESEATSNEVPTTPTSEDFHSNYQIGEELGYGMSSVVRQCRNLTTDVELAMKIIDLHSGVAPVEKLRSDALREIAILREIRGPPSVLYLEDSVETECFVFIVTDLCPHGDLFSLTAGVKQLGENRTLNVMHQLLAAVEHVHRRWIVHRDVKQENVLLAAIQPLRIKLGDFGLASAVRSDTDLVDVMGTPAYFSPEVLQMASLKEDKPAGYGRPADVWACGVLMYMLLIGNEPFHHSKSSRRRRLVLAGKFSRPDAKWERLSKESRSLIKQMLCTDPRKRPTVHELLRQIDQHPLKGCYIDTAVCQPLQRFRALVYAIIAFIRLRRLSGRVVKARLIAREPYSNKILSRLITEAAVGLYGHWVKRELRQTLRDLFQDDCKAAGRRSSQWNVSVHSSTSIMDDERSEG